LAELAAAQHGVITTRQLGLTSGAIAKRLKTGTLHRVHRGVYALGHSRLSERGRYMAAILAAGDGAVLGGLSAASLMKAWRRAVPEIHVLAPRTRAPQAGFVIHTTRHLDPRDVTELDGIPVTTMARTLVDLTDVLTVHQLRNVIHEAAFHRRFSESATRAAMGRAGGRRLNLLQEALTLEGAGTKSTLEDRFLSLIAQFPLPRTNVMIAGYEVDFVWPGLVVEIDGPAHRRPRTRKEDADRDAAMEAEGFATLRVTKADLDRPERLLRRLGLEPALRP
jgi:very-short-patch-repair endonuclease